MEALCLLFDRGDIELLDGSQKALKVAEKENVGALHCCLLHEFRADYSQYALVLGVWALCYLRRGDTERFLLDASNAETLIFIEPIKKASDGNPEIEEWGPREAQQMVLREESYYTKLFMEAGLEVLFKRGFGAVM